MTHSREPGAGAARSAAGLALLFRIVEVRVARWIRRHRPATGGTASDEAAFEAHVDQALRIARQMPTLSVVPGGQVRRAARP